MTTIFRPELRIDRLHETGGPTDLAVGVIGDGQIVIRSGNALIGSDTLPDSAPLDVNGFRVELGANATTLNASFVTSNQIKLYNSSSQNWEVCNITTAPTSNAVNALNIIGAEQALAVSKIYDVFAAYDSATAFDLEFSPWVTTGTGGNSARAAAYAGGTTYAVGDRVVDSSVYYVCIQAGSGHTPASSATYWTSCGAIPANTAFTGLYQADGIWVSGNSATQKARRWLGVIYTFNNSSAVNFKDSEKWRYVSNYYNPKVNTIGVTCPYASANIDTGISTTSWEKWNADSGDYDNFFVSCTTRSAMLTAFAPITAWTGNYVLIGIGINSSSVISANTYFYSSDTTYVYSAASVSQQGTFLGYNYLCPVQFCSATANVAIAFWVASGYQIAKASTTGYLEG